MIKVDVVPSNKDWRGLFEQESAQIRAALGKNLVAIHHIGSTSIPGIYAKPIIDILVEVQDLARVDAQTETLVVLGYEAMGEYGIPGRRYFRKHSSAGVRTHHVHTFAVGSPQVQRHLAFRDYLTAHPEDAQRYSTLKQQLAQAHPNDIEAYMDGKDGFIQEMDRKAAAWLASLAK
ncbi:MAG TPA: GrpB family protein [Leptolyngbyaceae cyanobacterium]